MLLTYYSFTEMRQVVTKGYGATNNNRGRNNSVISQKVFDKDFTLTTDSFQETIQLEDARSYQLIPSVQTEVEDDLPLDPEFQGQLTNIAQPDETYSNTATMKFYPLRDVLKYRFTNFQLNLHLALEVEVNYPTDIEALSILWDFSQCMLNAQVRPRRESVSGGKVLYHCVAAGLYKYVPATKPYFKISIEWMNRGISSSLAYTMNTQLYAFGLFGDSREEVGFRLPSPARLKTKSSSRVKPEFTQYSRSKAMILGY